jgi:hypothetical protein
MLRRARLWISNGHPASVVVKNQLLAIIIIYNFSALQTSNRAVGGSSLESLDIRFVGPGCVWLASSNADKQ